MKRHLNTSYRLVWNHITGTLVVASELARSRGKRAGVAIALSLAAVTSVPALAADTVVQAGETVSGGTLTNHDNQIVLGTANGMTISTGLEYGPDNEVNTGGQWIQNGGIRGRFRDADAYHLDQVFPLLMKQLELMLTSGELNPRHQHTVTLYAKGVTCEADTLGSCGYVYLAVYPTPETKK